MAAVSIPTLPIYPTVPVRTWARLPEAQRERVAIEILEVFAAAFPREHVWQWLADELRGREARREARREADRVRLVRWLALVDEARELDAERAGA